MREELLKGLTKEQIAKAKACKSQEEFLALAKKEGVELTSEQLEAISGGGCFSTRHCPYCGSNNYRKEKVPIGKDTNIVQYTCNDCGKKFVE